jgi:MoxR-like ATPase
MSALRSPAAQDAAHAFRSFFDELRGAFLERETLLSQVELGLLCREHVLVVGPPGTAKSAVAASVLGRIVDAQTGRPSLFAKQLSESTVQTDLVGPVDFKVLTETGRTEYLTDDGMLGATHAFIDEVFDGRDMLLRSILNVLHERELKHGRRITAGRTECAIMTSNRYLSEVLARSPEVLLAFADRISFVCFVPKAFARGSSRAAMLARATQGQRLELRARLTLQDLDTLQGLVEQVEVPADVAEALEKLADGLERALLAQVVKLPDYVPTKYFSQRSLVKALWALRACVVRDGIYQRPERPLVATVEDLEGLRAFFLLGGPPPAEAEVLVRSSPDPREKAQLEILRVEHRAFDEVMAGLRGAGEGNAAAEAEALQLAALLVGARAAAESLDARQVSDVVGKLQATLLPGPRHPKNRAAAVSACRALVDALALGLAGFPWPVRAVRREWLGAVAGLGRLCRDVPELRESAAPFLAAAWRWVGRAQAQVVLEWMGTGLEPAAEDGALVKDLRVAEADCAGLERLASFCAPAEERNGWQVRERETRSRVHAAFRARVAAQFTAAGGGGASGPLQERMSAGARQLAAIERALVQLSPDGAGLAREMLAPLATGIVAEALQGGASQSLVHLARELGAAAELIRREGLEPLAALQSSRERVQVLVTAAVGRWPPPGKETGPGPGEAVSGAAHRDYRERLHARRRDGEVQALLQLERLMGGDGGGFLPDAVRQRVFEAELGSVRQRLAFLRTWWGLVSAALPLPGVSPGRTEVEAALDAFVRSRFPQLVYREAELSALATVLDGLEACAVALGGTGVLGRLAEARAVLSGLEADVALRGRHLLEARAA